MTASFAGPDGNTPGMRIVECSRMTAVDMLRFAVSPAGILRVIMHELLTEVPGADFIEIRAVRYDKEDPGERSTEAASSG